MNNKPVLIIAIVLVLALLGGGAYVMTAGKAGSSESTAAGNQAGKKTADGNVPKTLRELLAAGVAQKCTFRSTEDVAVEGTTYVSGGKVRSDYTTSVEGNTMSGHMIADGTTSYIWMDGQQQGFTMTFNASDTDIPENTQTPGATKAPQQGLDANQAMDYSCSPWVVDGSLFTPPAEITFTDFSSMMPTGAAGAGISGSAGASMDACAACDSVPEAARAQCRTALNCQ